MNLDDLARAAGAEVRRSADEGVTPDPVRYRRRRQNRLNVFAVGGAVVALVTVLGVIAVTPPHEKSTAVGTTVPVMPWTTSTIGVDTRPDVTVVEIDRAGPVGAGWELIEARSVAGRELAAIAWTEDGLVVWGGVGPPAPGTSGPFLYRGGSIRDSASGYWRSMAPVDADGLCGGAVRALALGDRVLFYGANESTDGCVSAAIYHLQGEAWIPVDDTFASRLNLDTALVWTGEMVVAPVQGLAYEPERGTVTEVPALAPRLDQVVWSPLRAHWTGSEVVAVGSGPAFAWAPGDDAWQEIGAPGVSSTGRASVWAAGDGLWVVDYNRAVAVFGDSGWRSPGNLPLTFTECVPEAVAVLGTPVVRTCSGLAIWDAARATWVLAPLEVPGWGVQSDGVLVAAEHEDAVYSVGSHIYRFELNRLPNGGIDSAPAIPISQMELQMLDPWEFDRSFVSEATVGVTLTGPSMCTITASEGTWEPPSEFIGSGAMTVHNPGRAVFEATMYRSADAAARFGLAIPTEAETVFVRCDGGIDGDEAVLSEGAFTLASRLWWPSRPLIEEAPAYIAGPGWETLDAGPVAGRTRIAAAWTGDELFVWGGTDGFIQENPGLGAFHQDAYLFDPTADAWRPTAPPPDDLCDLTESQAMRLGDQVLLRGVTHGPAGCLPAALYSPATDSWQLLNSRFFAEVSILSHLVWTGEWLAAPSAGLAYVPSTAETITIPVVPEAGSLVGPATWSHWTGDRIITLGVGDVHVLQPGDPSWTRFPGPPLRPAGRSILWFEGGLFVVEYDNWAARFDLDEEVWQSISLPLRAAECDPQRLISAAALPIATACSGMAIWDAARSVWIPIPLESLTGTSWQPVRVVGGDAIYSLGEVFHRYPIEFESGQVVTPDIIPIGVALIKVGGYRITSTVGWSNVGYPDGSDGFALFVGLEGPGGRCDLISTYGGPPLGAPNEVLSVGATHVLVFDSADGMTDWAIPTGESDMVQIRCESEDDALTLARSLTIP